VGSIRAPDGQVLRPFIRLVAALEASAAGRELARFGRIAECPSSLERHRYGLTETAHQVVGGAIVVVKHVAGVHRLVMNLWT